MKLINADAENERLLDFIAEHDIGIEYAIKHKDMTMLEDIFFDYFNQQKIVLDTENLLAELNEKRERYREDAKIQMHKNHNEEWTQYLDGLQCGIRE